MQKRQFLRCLIVLTLLFWSSAAFAQAWDGTFEASAVHSYMSKDGQRYLVVAAGEANESTEAAAKSLEAALRSGSATLVMNDDALGSLEGLDDEAITKKAAALPIDRIVIVRVFAGASADAGTVVVTVRDKEGETIWALSGTQGVALEARTGGGGLGVSSGAAESVSGTVRESGKDSQAAQQEFAEKFIWSHDLVGVNQYGGVMMRSSTFYQGKYKKPLTSDAFFREVGRPDLAEELAAIETQQTIASTIGGVGLLGVIGSVPWWTLEWVDSMSDEDYSYTGPLILTGASITAVVISSFIYPDKSHPVTHSEALKLADQYNQRLKSDLGLDDDYSVIPDTSRSHKMHFSYGISPTPEGVSGAIRVDF